MGQRLYSLYTDRVMSITFFLRIGSHVIMYYCEVHEWDESGGLASILLYVNRDVEFFWNFNMMLTMYCTDLYYTQDSVHFLTFLFYL
jgi:hypothetical protein